MSIETIDTTITILEESEESLLERRTRLHREIGVIRPRIHELETRHRTLVMGLIALSTELTISAAESDITVHIGLTDERDELADTIHLLREEERRLIDEIATCNNNTIRERPEEFSGNKGWREKRRIEELPYVIQIHNEGEDPADLTAVNELDEESIGTHYRYLTNAAL